MPARTAVRRLASHLPPSPRAPTILSIRILHSTPQRRTDGVFRELNDSRSMLPWIDAFEARQQKQEHTDASTKRTAHPPMDMTPKQMGQSYHRVVLPLSKERSLADNYLNVSGRLRMGPIFMDLDALTGIITYKHTGEGVTNVTLAVDRIVMNRPITEICDLEYAGQVTYTKDKGSSMEVTCTVSRARPDGQASKPEDLVMTARFILVSCDPETSKGTPNPPLDVQTDAERELFEAGEASSRQRRALSAPPEKSGSPSEADAALTHSIWQQGVAEREAARIKGTLPQTQSMSKTELKSALIMQPQYRNRHNYVIFGGFLLKQTYELAFCCSTDFANAEPRFVSTDFCQFFSPVPVGTLLHLSAQIVHCDPLPGNGSNQAGRTRISVRVESRTRDFAHAVLNKNGFFFFTFEVDRAIEVMPESYGDFQAWLEGRRRMLRFDSPENKGARRSLSVPSSP